jgi:hypothetical protein
MKIEPTVTVIPAQPGFWTVHLFDTDEPNDVILGDPVIAWRIETEQLQDGRMLTTSYAITPDGEDDTSHGMQYPNGVVVLQSVYHRDLATAREWWMKEAEERATHQRNA